MKKTIKTLVVMVMAVIMLTASAIPALASDFDFATSISAFKSNSNNTFTLNSGETHSPSAALWVQRAEDKL